MTETSTPTAADKPENVGRGTLFALATIPIAFIVFGIFGYLQFYPFIVGIATPFVAAWLYRLGSGGKLTRSGWVPFIVISLVSVALGGLAGVIGAAYKVFGSGGQFGNAILVQLRNFNPANGGGGFFLLLGVVLGVIGIFVALRQANATPAQQIAQTTAQWTPPPADPAAPPPPAAPTATLNGEPLDADAKDTDKKDTDKK